MRLYLGFFVGLSLCFAVVSSTVFAQIGETPPAVETPLVVASEVETLPRDLSPMGMYRAADQVVKSVLIGLAAASVMTWTIWLVKFFEIAGAKIRARRSLKVIATAGDLADARARLGARRGPAAGMVLEAYLETERSSEVVARVGGDGLKERVSSSLSRVEAAAVRRIANGVGVLAIIGSTGPFVGLFGTVWGIMNAFIGISEAQTTNLAVVAPGIAEALLATAAGLVAAIPAVVIYNIFARSIAGYRQLLGDAAAGVEQLVSRDLDYQRMQEEDAATKALVEE